MTSYRPGSFYRRKKIRSARTLEKAKEAGLAMVAELEELRAWVREQGLVPPKRMCEEEARDILANPATEWQRELVKEAEHGLTGMGDMTNP